MPKEPTEAAEMYMDDEKNDKLHMHKHWCDQLERKAIRNRVYVGMLIFLFMCLVNSMMVWRMETNIANQLQTDRVMFFDKMENLTREIKDNNQFEYMFVKKRSDSKELVERGGEGDL